MNSSFKHQLHTFDSGLRLVTVPMPATKTVTVFVLVGTGSKYETKEINGISHFLEHMMFKGTTQRPGKMDIAKELDSIGAEYNAFTGKEYTGYYARASSLKFDTIADVVFDIFLNSKLDKDEIEKEKGVIIEEINMYYDNPQMYIGELFEDLLYGDQPAGWSIAGKKETVSNLNREKIANYFHAHYIASDTIVAISGDITHEKAKAKVEECFKNIRQDSKVSKLPVVENQTKPELVINNRKTDQSNFSLGFKSYNMFDDKIYPTELLATVLGGWMSSRLFIEVRDNRGLAYHIEAGTSHETDSGHFYVHAGVNNNKIYEAIEATINEIMKVKKDGITKEELQKAKDYAEGRLAMSLENSRVVAQSYAGPILFKNKVITPEEELAKIKAVTLEQVKNVANEIFKNDKLNLAVIGPHEDETKLKSLLVVD